jgi:predicted methyltransferase
MELKECDPMKIAAAIAGIVLSVGIAKAQEKSVRPGVNDPFKDPDLKKFSETFEGESREVFAKREQIAAAVGLKPGMEVADVGAGTGLFSRIFASQVGPMGKVYAVDIAQKFLDHIDQLNRKAGVSNVKTVLCSPVSVSLPPASVDVAFICDTYHHFEYPARTMASIHKALKPGGRVVLVDFRRVAGESSDWVMNHVRAGQEVFEREIVEAGFNKVREEKSVLKENYLVVFEKIEAKAR